MNLYESCKTPIRVAYFGFALIAVGFLIQNPNVNLFYTFKSTVVLFTGELFIRIGEIIVMNLPLIFMLSIVCKKANSGSPLVMALVGYFSFIVTTMLFANQSLGSQAYTTGTGINSIFNLANGTRLPLETGLLGSLLVAYITRLSYIYSRNRGSYSIFALLNKDTTGIIINFVLCFLAGILVSYGYPILYQYLQKAITYIGQDLMDPLRIGIYGVLDRVLSILGLSNVIRYPFWFTSIGGSYTNTLTGQNVLGDVNIWTYVKDSITGYVGAGRFITPYYIINMFIIPGFYLGTLFSMTDNQERNGYILMFMVGIGLSIVAGNPLPVELIMLFTSPGLLITYLIEVGGVFAVLVKLQAFLGFSATSQNTAVAMPGSFPDFIINIRNTRLLPSLGIIVIVGAACLILSFLSTLIYYHVFAFDVVKTGSGDKLVSSVIKAAGGTDNIKSAGSGLYRLIIRVDDLEKVLIDDLQDIGARRISEIRDGICIEFGTSSTIIAKRINEALKGKHFKQNG